MFKTEIYILRLQVFPNVDELNQTTEVEAL